MSTRRTDRLRLLLALLRDGRSHTTRLLSAELGVSPATLRRDLDHLADQGLIVRSHGAARAVDRDAAEIPLRLRDSRLLAIKRRIAQHAAALVPVGSQVVALSGGVTAGEVARALRGRSGLTLVTNSLNIAVDSAVDAQTSVVVIGGLVRATSLEAVGPMAEQAVHGLTIDIAILGADGLSSHAGATAHDAGEARTVAAMSAQAERTIVAVDGTKVGAVTRVGMLPLARVDHVVTDSTADPHELARLETAGVRVHRVPPVR